MNDAIYYRPTGWLSPARLVALVVPAAAAVVVLSLIYVAAMQWCPLIYAKVTMTATFGAVLGVGSAFLSKKAHVRREPVGIIIAALLAVFACHAQWVAYLHVAVDGAPWFLHPADIWEMMTEINGAGLWSVNGVVPTGVALWGVWFIEAAILIGLSVFISTQFPAPAFCEACQRWTERARAFGPFLPVTDPASVRGALERRAYANLDALKPSEPAPEFAFAEVMSCAACKAFHVFNLANARMVQGEKGMVRVDDPVVQRLMVPGTVLKTLTALEEAKNQPAS